MRLLGFRRIEFRHLQRSKCGFRANIADGDYFQRKGGSLMLRPFWHDIVIGATRAPRISLTLSIAVKTMTFEEMRSKSSRRS